MNCNPSKGHGSALMKSTIRFALSLNLKEIHGHMIGDIESGAGLRQFNFYQKFGFHIGDEGKVGRPITLFLSTH